MPLTPFIPPVQSALWLAAQQVAARRLGRARRPSMFEKVVGAACIGAGSAVGGIALMHFVRDRTTWHPWSPHESSALVTTGPNAFSRNPMYAGLALGLVGTGLLSGAPWTAAAAGGLIATLTPQVQREEDALGQIFGSEWTDYATAVRRWA